MIRARSRTPNRTLPADLAPTPSRAGIPPSGDFDPLELDFLRGELSEELSGRGRFERLSRVRLQEIATLFYSMWIFYYQ